MIAMILLLLAQDAPMSESLGRAFPAKQLTCAVHTEDEFYFALKVTEDNGVARVKSGREDLFPAGEYRISPASITRSEGGKPVNYRVSIAADRPSGHYSLGMQVEGGVPTQAWLRLTPPGPLRSDRIREIGSARCQAENKS